MLQTVLTLINLDARGLGSFAKAVLKLRCLGAEFLLKHKLCYLKIVRGVWRNTVWKIIHN